ncbi:ABC transporter ATP-binding protein [Clostridium omnivorum]|uniref:Antibiotic ABC transporter ATP-binding protein n=1 Tax=Clostridium omnivorum TaxID=1604902 RepID=A0ABQ5N8S0_9CLOT|nr:ABC transporter ATP-binding protein [Clostridium sp. E14]GLC31650.1 antibiotic ABC transporter ATP-binding protein [Clostridium sp. E14]
MIVEINNLVKRYKDFIAVDNLNLSIKEGEIFGLLGPNGAGKTTTINTILGLSKKDSGEVKIFGKSMDKYEEEIKRNIGVVPQNIAVFNDLTAYENVEFFGRLYGLRGKLLKERVEEALEFTGLLDRKKDYPGKYSGGMQRRLNIACAIVHKPKLIIMDEPTVGIDPQSRNHILNSVKKLNEGGSTVIYTSHYMEEIEELCTDITIMDHGKVIAKGTKEDLKSLVSLEEKLTLTLSNVNYTMVDEIKRISGVKDCIVEDRNITVISKKDCRNLSRIIDAVNNSNSEILGIDVEKPSLEGVFLTLTGRKLRD